MDVILYFFRDSISGVQYVIYAFICIFLMFSIIGYLFKQKYAKVELKLSSSQPQVENTSKNIKKTEEPRVQQSKILDVKPIPSATTTTTNLPINNNLQHQLQPQVKPQVVVQPNTQLKQTTGGNALNTQPVTSQASIANNQGQNINQIK